MPKRPVVRFELNVSISAPRPVIESLAKSDGRVRITHGSAELSVRSERASDAIAELQQFADGIRKATKKSERV